MGWLCVELAGIGMVFFLAGALRWGWRTCLLVAMLIVLLDLWAYQP